MSAETKYKEIVKQLEQQLEKSIDEACSRIHSEIVPYINDDTEFNAVFRANDIVTSIIQGNFTVSDDGLIECDGWRLQMTSDQYDKAVDALAAKAGDPAKDAKIARLEKTIEDLRDDMGFV